MTVDWCGPAWLKPLFREQEDSIFHRVTELTIAGRDVPDDIADLRYLQSVNVIGSRISEKAFRRLSRVKTFLHSGAYVYDEEQRYQIALNFTPNSFSSHWGSISSFVSPPGKVPVVDWGQSGMSALDCKKGYSSTLVSFACPSDQPSDQPSDAPSDSPGHNAGVETSDQPPNS